MAKYIVAMHLMITWSRSFDLVVLAV